MKASRFIRLGLTCVIILFLNQTVVAGSATWSTNPTGADWNTAANWNPQTVPNGPDDIATFDSSAVTDITLSATATEVNGVIFNPGASQYDISADSRGGADINLTISGAGITNNSPVVQRFSVVTGSISHQSALFFKNSATVGSKILLAVFGATHIGTNGGLIEFDDNASAGNALGVVEGARAGHETGGGAIVFHDNSTAGNARLRVDGAHHKGGEGGGVSFYDSSSAADAVFVINPAKKINRGAGAIGFSGLATAGNGRFLFTGSSASYADPAEAFFTDGATGGDAYFELGGGAKAGAFGTDAFFFGNSFTGLITTAGNATFVMAGGTAAGAQGGHIGFSQDTTAAQARLIANGGSNGGEGGFISFQGTGDGGEAHVELHGNGYLDISYLTGGVGVTIGSLAGDGPVYLASHKLTVGSNNLDTSYAGVIQENGGGVGGTPGSLAKIGSGRLTLEGASTYTGGTTVSAGILEVANSDGSASGTGPVQVNGGILGGGGIISGAVTIGDGQNAGATLAPSAGKTEVATLTMQGSLTFKSDGVYQCALNDPGEADSVIANGVTINGAAQFELMSNAAELPTGSVFTVILNNSATAIAGTFANLADGAVIMSGLNKFQATYSGGDGNDLTLTVVP